MKTINRPLAGDKDECAQCSYHIWDGDVIPCNRINWARTNVLEGCSWFECETCENTGYYGDNGPGYLNNKEYHKCDCCKLGLMTGDLSLEKEQK